MPRFTAGFTLIELLVVIAIIGVLTSIVMVSLSGAKQKSRDARRVADIKTLQLALGLYYNDNLFYPLDMTASSNAVPGSSPQNGLVPAYLPVLPRDPNGAGTCTTSSDVSCYKYYGYRSGSGGCNSANVPVKYQLGAKLEDITNKALLDDVDYDLTSNGYTACHNNANANGFLGNSADCTTTAGIPQGTAGGTELCYSQQP